MPGRDQLRGVAMPITNGTDTWTDTRTRETVTGVLGGTVIGPRSSPTVPLEAGPATPGNGHYGVLISNTPNGEDGAVCMTPGVRIRVRVDAAYPFGTRLEYAAGGVLSEGTSAARGFAELIEPSTGPDDFPLALLLEPTFTTGTTPQG